MATTCGRVYCDLLPDPKPAVCPGPAENTSKSDLTALFEAAMVHDWGPEAAPLGGLLATLLHVEVISAPPGLVLPRNSPAPSASVQLHVTTDQLKLISPLHLEGLTLPSDETGLLALYVALVAVEEACPECRVLDLLVAPDVVYQTVVPIMDLATIRRVGEDHASLAALYQAPISQEPDKAFFEVRFVVFSP